MSTDEEEEDIDLSELLESSPTKRLHVEVTTPPGHMLSSRASIAYSPEEKKKMMLNRVCLDIKRYESDLEQLNNTRRYIEQQLEILGVAKLRLGENTDVAEAGSL